MTGPVRGQSIRNTKAKQALLRARGMAGAAIFNYIGLLGIADGFVNPPTDASPSRSTDHQNRDLAVGQHLGGLTAKQKCLQSFSAVGGHHDEIALQLPRLFDDCNVG